MKKNDKKNGDAIQKEKKSGSLFKRRLNYGIGYLTLIAAVLVVFVLVNVILERLPMSVDLTANEQFSITEETEKILDELSKRNGGFAAGGSDPNT